MIFLKFLMFVGIACAIVGIVSHIIDEARRANLPNLPVEEQRRVVLKRLERQYQADGVKDAYEAAQDHISNLEKIERFRRHASIEYLKGKQSLRELEDECIAANYATYRRLGFTDARNQRAARAFELALKATPVEEILMGEAGEKWRREIEDAIRSAKQQSYDDVAQHVIGGLYRSI
jgi:hypothetical protein